MSGGDTTYLGDASDVFVRWEVATSSGLGALAAFEVESLNILEGVFVVSELRLRQFVKVAAVGDLLFGKHASFGRADSSSRLFGPQRHGDFRFLGQRTVAHVGNEKRDFKFERFASLWIEATVGSSGVGVAWGAALASSFCRANSLPA